MVHSYCAPFTYKLAWHCSIPQTCLRRLQYIHATCDSCKVGMLLQAQGSGDRREVMIQAQASFRTISGLMGQGSGPVNIFV